MATQDWLEGVADLPDSEFKRLATDLVNESGVLMRMKHDPYTGDRKDRFKAEDLPIAYLACVLDRSRFAELKRCVQAHSTIFKPEVNCLDALKEFGWLPELWRMIDSLEDGKPFLRYLKSEITSDLPKAYCHFWLFLIDRNHNQTIGYIERIIGKNLKEELCRGLQGELAMEVLAQFVFQEWIYRFLLASVFARQNAAEFQSSIEAELLYGLSLPRPSEISEFKSPADDIAFAAAATLRNYQFAALWQLGCRLVFSCPRITPFDIPAVSALARRELESRSARFSNRLNALFAFGILESCVMDSELKGTILLRQANAIEAQKSVFSGDIVIRVETTSDESTLCISWKGIIREKRIKQDIDVVRLILLLQTAEADLIKKGLHQLNYELVYMKTGNRRKKESPEKATTPNNTVDFQAGMQVKPQSKHRRAISNIRKSIDRALGAISSNAKELASLRRSLGLVENRGWLGTKLGCKNVHVDKGLNFSKFLSSVGEAS